MACLRFFSLVALLGRPWLITLLGDRGCDVFLVAGHVAVVHVVAQASAVQKKKSRNSPCAIVSRGRQAVMFASNRFFAQSRRHERHLCR